MSVYVGECVGSCESAARALLAEQLLLLLSSPAPLVVQIWGGSHFEEYKISYPGRSLQRACTWAPRLVSAPSAQTGPRILPPPEARVRRLQNLQGRELSPLQPRAARDLQTGQSLTEEAGGRDHPESAVALLQRLATGARG